MVVTVFRSRVKPESQQEYAQWAGRMSALAKTMPGYISHKGFVAEDGERVTIDISQRADSLGSGPARGSISTQQLSTTVSGRLGEWIELGGTSQQVGGNQAGSFGRATSGGQDTGSIWLKVEEVQ